MILVNARCSRVLGVDARASLPKPSPHLLYFLLALLYSLSVVMVEAYQLGDSTVTFMLVRHLVVTGMMREHLTDHRVEHRKE